MPQKSRDEKSTQTESFCFSQSTQTDSLGFSMCTPAATILSPGHVSDLSHLSPDRGCLSSKATENSTGCVVRDADATLLLDGRGPITCRANKVPYVRDAEESSDEYSSSDESSSRGQSCRPETPQRSKGPSTAWKHEPDTDRLSAPQAVKKCVRFRLEPVDNVSKPHCGPEGNWKKSILQRHVSDNNGGHVTEPIHTVASGVALGSADPRGTDFRRGILKRPREGVSVGSSGTPTVYDYTGAQKGVTGLSPRTGAHGSITAQLVDVFQWIQPPLHPTSTQPVGSEFLSPPRSISHTPPRTPTHSHTPTPTPYSPAFTTQLARTKVTLDQLSSI